MSGYHRKEVGFIKSSSKKNIQNYQESNSSDSFSSFQYDPNSERQTQFSPYKHPTLREQHFKLSSNPKIKSQNNPILSNQHPPKFSNLILRNNFTLQPNDKHHKQSLEVRNKPQQSVHPDKKYKLQGSDQILYKQQSDEFDQQLSLSNLHKFQKSRQNKEHQNQINNLDQKETKPIGNYRKYAEQQSSNEEQSSPKVQYKQTVKNNRQRNKQEQLIIEYDKRQFMDKRIKTAILQQNKQNPVVNKGEYETKGGICFELDTRQFKGNSTTVNTLNKKKKKKIESDPKVLLMQRRQTAKNYDRQARYKLFGY